MTRRQDLPLMQRVIRTQRPACRPSKEAALTVANLDEYRVENHRGQGQRLLHTENLTITIHVT